MRTGDRNKKGRPGHAVGQNGPEVLVKNLDVSGRQRQHEAVEVGVLQEGGMCHRASFWEVDVCGDFPSVNQSPFTSFCLHCSFVQA